MTPQTPPMDDPASHEATQDSWDEMAAEMTGRCICIHVSEIATALRQAAAKGREQAAVYMDRRADEIDAADNLTANMMARIFRDEAKAIRLENGAGGAGVTPPVAVDVARCAGNVDQHSAARNLSTEDEP